VEQPKQVELAKQAEQNEAEQRKAVERKIDRQKRYADRKTRQIATTRMKQRQLEQGQPAKPELAYDQVEQPHLSLFESLSAPLLDRSSDVAPDDRRDGR
jgi:uncharacterized protein YjcR